MKRTLSDEQLRASTEIPFDANSSDDSFQDPPVEQTQSEPALFNRTAANPPMEMVDEVNRPSTPANTHSAPEKSDRSTSASSAATIATSDDEISSLKKAAEQGDAVAQYKLGVRYDKGDGVEKNKEEAFARFHKAAELGYANAMFNVGVRRCDSQRTRRNEFGARTGGASPFSADADSHDTCG